MDGFTCRDFDFVKDKEAFTEFLRKRGDMSEVDFSFFPPLVAWLNTTGFQLALAL